MVSDEDEPVIAGLLAFSVGLLLEGILGLLFVGGDTGLVNVGGLILIPIVLAFNVGLLLGEAFGLLVVGADAGRVSPFEYPIGGARLRGFTFDKSTWSGSGGA